MSFAQWEGEMGIAERYHRKLLYLVEVQAGMTEQEEEDRRKWIASLDRAEQEEESMRG